MGDVGRDSSVASLAREVAEEVLIELQRRKRPRGSTYRLQFNAGFTFRDATRIVPYLHNLGVTHVYASPYLTAQPGSPHGYDVCRHDQLNPEIGTREDYAAFVAALKEHGMGQVLDTVPNHMAASSHNPWWMDVLENGPSSPYSHYFDIDWHPTKAELTDRVLLPILGDRYGKVLESGQLKLEYAEGAFVVRYYDAVLPIGPRSSIAILSLRIDELGRELGETSDAFLELQSILTALQHLPSASATSPQQMAERQREKEIVKRRLKRLESEEPQIAEFLRRNVEIFNGTPGDPASFDRLDNLLRDQPYRLCNWRAASDEVNYRRFFDVNGLAAICVEAADVFEHTHRLVMQLLARGDVDGLRIDHIDGLLDPSRYLWRLQWSYLAELARQAFEQRMRLPLSVDEETAPPLAIACDQQAISIATEGTQLPPPEVAGAIGGAVMAQEDSRRAAGAVFEVAPAVTWTELRPEVMRVLCDHLHLPYPDDDLLRRDSKETAEGSIETAQHPSIYTRSFASPHDLPLYVLVEKILGPDEPLPDNWPVAGTSGYDFLQSLNGLIISPQGLRELTKTYEKLIDERLDFAEVVYLCKLLILRFSMASELQMLAHRLNRISEESRQSRDFTLNMLRHALREILANFPVYRTYAGPAGVTERDRHFTNLAIARAKRRSPTIESDLFEFIRKILLLDLPHDISDASRQSCELFAGRFQQVTSPIMAKGVEDTAFYQYFPLVSANEVGSHPDVAPVSVEAYHRESSERLARYPLTMLATSTHDTKRSEDIRAKISILSEIPGHWKKQCNRWYRLNRRHHAEVDGLPAPSVNDEYLFYQTLVGVWPLQEPGDEELQQLVARLQAYMEKATHEAKVRTSWTNPNTAYDEAVRHFIAKVLERRKDNSFLSAFRMFHESIVDLGLFNAISQTALKILSPGIPDIYQSQELWDFSLVDPDNRRPVDYDQRRQLLSEITEAENDCSRSCELAQSLRNTPRNPRLKLFVTQKLLKLRQREPELFTSGTYVPLTVEDEAANHVCAFCWHSNEPAGQQKQLVVVVPRLLAQLAAENEAAHGIHRLWSPEVWRSTGVRYVISPQQRMRNLFTGEAIAPMESLLVSNLFSKFCIAILANF